MSKFLHLSDLDNESDYVEMSSQNNPLNRSTRNYEMQVVNPID